MACMQGHLHMLMTSEQLYVLVQEDPVKISQLLASRHTGRLRLRYFFYIAEKLLRRTVLILSVLYLDALVGQYYNL